MKLRVNPATGRLAERLPADVPTQERGPCRWFTYTWDIRDGLAVELLTEQDVADWPDVVLAPAPPAPEYAYTLACSTCDPHPLHLDAFGRDCLAAAHNDGETAAYAVRLQHPSRHESLPVPTFKAGAEVTFHGSGPGESARLVDAIVESATDHVDSDGETVSGYVVRVDGKAMFVPGSALARHAV